MDAQSQRERNDAFDRLYGRYRRLVEWTCWIYSDEDIVLCQDLYQESLIAIWQRALSLQPDASPSQERKWVLWQCRSICLRYRKRQPPKMLPIEAAVDVPDESVAFDEVSEMVEELAEDLSPKERTLFDLIVGNYDSTEIDRLLGIRHRSTIQLRYRMLERMRQTYENHYSNDTPRD